jgi:hypothetical protein
MVKLPKWFWVVAFVVCWPTLALADPVLAAEQNGVRIVIHSENCKYKGVVSNLPKRATWTEKGKTFEGCAGVVPQLGMTMFYFSADKTIAVVPMEMFAPVTGV